MFRCAAIFFVFAVLGLRADQRWDIQYRYRHIDSTLTINDLVFPSEKRGIACGYTTDNREKDHSLVLLTSDGGSNWTESPVKETGIALFFLDDSTGWMVTDKSIWTTAESGRSWTRLNKAPAGMLRIWFLDRQHGFVAGLEKRVFETTDGGAVWTPLDILKEVQGNVAFTTFGEIAFSGDKGIVSGWNIPPRPGGPDWMETNQAAMRIQTPHYSVMLETLDGGKKWIKSEASVFGTISRISLTPQGAGLGLIEFKDVEKINMHTGKSERCFRQKDRAITDVRLFAGSNAAVIAGYETTGLAVRSPIPGKVKVLTSGDLENWKEMPVDYRAVAHAVIIAGPDEKNLWIATDTGMILKLVTE
jgi:hypothetical protein